MTIKAVVAGAPSMALQFAGARPEIPVTVR